MNSEKMVLSEKKQLFSIIIPVYNVEEYLKECLDSVVSQSYDNLEIICVNDGSTDGSLRILEGYAASDARIRIINQKNRGLSGARNTGIIHAKGEFVYFLDSDDYISEDSIKKIIEYMTGLKLDMLCFDAVAFDDTNGELIQYTDSLNKYYQRKGEYLGVYSGKDFLRLLQNKYDYQNAVWGYVYRKSFLTKNSFLFIEGIYHEDLDFTYKCLLAANRIAHLPIVIYHRRVRNNSITTIDKNFMHVYGHFVCINSAFNLISDANVSEPFFVEQSSWIINNLVSKARLYYKDLPPNEREKYKDLSPKEFLLFYFMIHDPSIKDIQIRELRTENKNYELKQIEHKKLIDTMTSQKNTLNVKCEDLNIKHKELQDRLLASESELKEIKESRLYRYLCKIREIKNCFFKH